MANKKPMLYPRLLQAVLTPTQYCYLKVSVTTIILLVFLIPGHSQSSPTLSKNFTPGTIGPGSTSLLTLVINNAGTTAATDISFVDNLPAGVVLSDHLLLSNSCEGNLGAAPGGSSVSLSDGRLGAGSSCSISIAVTSSVPGTHTNTTSALSSSNGSGVAATADLIVVADRPGISMNLTPSSVAPFQRSTLEILIDNTANGNDLNTVAFNLTLGEGLEYSSPSNISTTCPASVPPFQPSTLSISGNTLSIANYTAAASSSCTVHVDIRSTLPGVFNIVTSELQSRNDFGLLNPSGFAVTSLEVQPAFMIKSFQTNPVSPGSSVDLVYTLTNRDRSNTATNISFTDDFESALTGVTIQSISTGSCGGTDNGTGTGIFSYSGGTLTAGSTCLITVTLDIPPGASSGVYPSVSSDVSYDLGGSPVLAGPASDQLYIDAVPILSIDYSQDVVQPGDVFDLTFTIENTDPLNSLTDIAFTDDFTQIVPAILLTPTPSTTDCGGSSSAFISDPSGTPILTFSGGTLAAASSCSFTVQLQIPDANSSNGTPTAGTQLNTTSKVTGQLNGVIVEGTSGSDEFSVHVAPILQIVPDQNQYAPGATVMLTYQLLHNENALGDATNIAFSHDFSTLFANATIASISDIDCGATIGTASTSLLEFSGGSLQPGTSCSFAVTVDVPISQATGTYQNETSQVTADVNGTSANSAPSMVELTVPAITFTKSFSNDPVEAGDPVQLDFTISNDDVLDATNISFGYNPATVLSGLTVDPSSLPSSGECGNATFVVLGTTLSMTGGSVLAGSSCSFSIVLDVPLNADDAFYPSQTESMLAEIDGEVLVIPGAIDELIILKSAQLLTLSKSLSVSSLFPGDQTQMTYEISFLGSATASNIAFTDDIGTDIPGAVISSIDGNTCSSIPITGSSLSFSGETLTSGNSCSFTVTIDIPTGLASGDYTSVSSSITADGGISGPAASATATILEQVRNDPVADAGPDQTIECVGPEGANVTLDGSGSTSDSPPLSYSWSIGGQVVSTEVSPTLTLGLGTHVVTLTVSDNVGTSSDMVTIIVEDTQAPTLTCPTPIMVNNDPGLCEASVSVLALLTDNCGATVQNDYNANGLDASDIYPVGTTTVNFEATDGGGNTADCSVDVTVIDAEAPTIDCPTDITVNNDPGSCGAIVTYTDPVGTDNCPAPNTIQIEGLGSGALFPVGTTTETFEVTDGGGLTESCSFSITVNDTELPQITCPANIIVPNNVGTCDAVVNYTTPVGTDNCPGPVTVLIVGGGSGATFPLGSTTETYEVTDASGNTAMCSFTVTVSDTSKPVITLNGEPFTVFRFSGPYTEPIGLTTASDNCDGDVTSSIIVDASAVNTNVLGFYDVIYSVTDAAGNIRTVTRSIEVIDDPAVLDHDYLLLAGQQITASKIARLDGAIHANSLISLGQGVNLNQGGPTVYDGEVTAVTQITVARNNLVNGNITAPSVSLGNNTQIGPGYVVTETTVPAVNLITLSISAGGPNTTIASGTSITLVPGSYGHLTVQGGATLNLNSGEYNFTGITLQGSSNVIVNLLTGPVELNSETQILIQDDAVVSLASGENDSEYLKIQSLTDVFIGDDVTLAGQINAINGQVNLGDDVSFRGSICAKFINIGEGSAVIHHDATGVLPKASIDDEKRNIIRPQLSEIVVNPNPFVSFLSVSGKAEVGRATLRVLDVNGRETFSQLLPEGAFKLELNTSTWLPGTYLVVLQQEQLISTQKLIKID